jgi:hypothetical protein
MLASLYAFILRGKREKERNKEERKIISPM